MLKVRQHLRLGFGRHVAWAAQAPISSSRAEQGLVAGDRPSPLDDNACTLLDLHRLRHLLRLRTPGLAAAGGSGDGASAARHRRLAPAAGGWRGKGAALVTFVSIPDLLKEVACRAAAEPAKRHRSQLLIRAACRYCCRAPPQGAIMSTLFYEPSTRTRLSFERQAGCSENRALRGMSISCMASAAGGSGGVPWACSDARGDGQLTLTSLSR